MNSENHRRMHIGVGLFLSVLIFFLTSLDIIHVIILYILWISFSNIPDKDQNISFLNHRGFSHTFWVAGIFGIISYQFVLYIFEFINVYVGYWAFSISITITLSYSFHIIQDMMTKGGGFSVKPFWPISSKNMSYGRWKYDSLWFVLITWFVLVLSITGSLIFMDHMEFIEVVDPTIELVNRYL